MQNEAILNVADKIDTQLHSKFHQVDSMSCKTTLNDETKFQCLHKIIMLVTTKIKIRVFCMRIYFISYTYILVCVCSIEKIVCVKN